MAGYYDQILVTIAAVLIAGASASIHPSIALHEGLAGGSLFATILLYEITFRNPPVEPTRSTTAASIVVGVSWLFTIVLLFL